MNTGKILALCAAAALMTSCSKNNMMNDADLSADRAETMYQVATLQSLMVGNYDGFITTGELLRHGDIGLGTFDRVDGEMIVVDGTVYQARYDGTVKVADGKLGTPFATVTTFDADITLDIAPLKSLGELAEQLDAAVEKSGFNLIYALRIDAGEFESIHVRSVVPQEKPYRPLAEAMKTDQREFTYNHIGGTVVAVRFPKFFASQNLPDWHFHFISDNRTKGGHMLDMVTSAPVRATLDATPYFNLYMPEAEEFSRRDLSKDMSEDIRDVEN